MTEAKSPGEETLDILHETGAILTGHFVKASRKHGSKYINKDAVYPHTFKVERIGSHMAQSFIYKNIQVVVGPEKGGIILSQWIAFHLNHYAENPLTNPVLAVYAEKKGDGFVLKRDYDKHVRGKRVLIVEDILTTGGSVKKLANMVSHAGGEVIAAMGICNCGGVTAEMAGVPELSSLVKLDLEAHEEEDCPYCRDGVPINTNVGKGAEFLARKQQALA